MGGITKIKNKGLFIFKIIDESRSGNFKDNFFKKFSHAFARLCRNLQNILRLAIQKSDNFIFCFFDFGGWQINFIYDRNNGQPQRLGELGVRKSLSLDALSCVHQ